MERVWRLLAAGSGGGRANRLLHIWAWYERLDALLFPTQPIPEADAGFARVTFTHHTGAPFTLPDGTHVQPGTRLCRLHLSSTSLRNLAHQNIWLLPPIMRADLRALAEAVERDELPSFEAMYGRTVLAHLGPRFGFIVRPRRHTLKTFLDRVYLQGLLILYSQCGVVRLFKGRTGREWPDETWMSRSELLRLYGSG
jgi:hypothetical protein